MLKYILNLSIIFLFIFSLYCGEDAPYLNTAKVKKIKKTEISQNELLFTFFLLGDTGNPEGKNKQLWKVLASFLQKQNPNKTRTFLLGDNVYPVGLPNKSEKNYKKMLARLNFQLDFFSELKQKVVFIPGNHDWNRSRKKGASYIRNQAYIVNHHPSKLFRFLPADVKPGPAVLNFSGNIKVLILDSEWFMQKDNRKKKKQIQASLQKLKRELVSGEKYKTIVLAHHPLYSGGRHGGYVSAREYFSPPLLGLLKVIYRKFHKSRSDIVHPRYKRYSEKIKKILKQNPPFIYAAGHDHSLQLLHNAGSIPWQIISGGGMLNHITPAGKIKQTVFAQGSAGFMILHYLKNGKIILNIVTVSPGTTVKIYSIGL